MDDDDKFYAKASREIVALCQQKARAHEAEAEDPADIGGVMMQLLTCALALVIITRTHPETRNAMLKMAGIWTEELTHEIETQLGKEP